MSRRTPEQVQAWRDDDARLADALLSGQPGAHARAWRRLSPPVRRIVFQHVPASADGPDLCQEVFLRFFSRIAELRARRALRSFLIGICRPPPRPGRPPGRLRRRPHVGSGSTVKKNVAPCPTAPSAQTRPPWRRMIRSTVASPMPVPGKASSVWSR